MVVLVRQTAKVMARVTTTTTETTGMPTIRVRFVLARITATPLGAWLGVSVL